VQHNGAPCVSASQCKSGFCVDSVCCDSSCAEQPCHACAAALSVGGDGVCAFAASGADPHDDCPDDGVPSCGRDGACDGGGACRPYAAGIVCGVVACEANSAAHYTCDGPFYCAKHQTDCLAYGCADGVCRVQCVFNADCAPDAWCDAGECRLKEPPGDHPCTI